jgi:hypothetical protein
MTPAQLLILQHALGADEYGQMPKRGSERNHYGTDDPSECSELVLLGYMVECQKVSWIPHTMYRVTEAGRKAMRDASPKAPKVSAGKLRWQEYLDYSDAFDCTFREWLDIRKSDWYKDMKAGRLC